MALRVPPDSFRKDILFQRATVGLIGRWCRYRSLRYVEFKGHLALLLLGPLVLFLGWLLVVKSGGEGRGVESGGMMGWHVCECGSDLLGTDVQTLQGVRVGGGGGVGTVLGEGAAVLAGRSVLG